MPRRAPTYAALVPRPRDLSPEALAAEGSLSRKGACAFLGVSMTKLKDLLARRVLPSVKSGGRVLVLKSGCRAYLEQLIREQA
jgi:excisionase family DNA binding protein